MLKAAWHWGSNTSIVNDPLGEPGPTPIVCGPCVRVGVRGRRKKVDCGNEASLSSGTLRGEPGYEGSFIGNSDSYIRRKEGFGNGASVSLYRASVKGTWRDSPTLRTTRDI